jgi:myo-inositol-1-phosphate synthase
MSKKNKKVIHFGDDLEKQVADLLIERGVKFLHESQYNKGQDRVLDFYLPDFDVYIEVKQFHTERSSGQLSSQDNVILIQGRKSIEFLKQLKNRSKD